MTNNSTGFGDDLEVRRPLAFWPAHLVRAAGNTDMGQYGHGASFLQVSGGEVVPVIDDGLTLTEEYQSVSSQEDPKILQQDHERKVALGD